MLVRQFLERLPPQLPNTHHQRGSLSRIETHAKYMQAWMVFTILIAKLRPATADSLIDFVLPLTLLHSLSEPNCQSGSLCDNIWAEAV